MSRAAWSSRDEYEESPFDICGCGPDPCRCRRRPLAIRARGESTADKVWGTPRAEVFDSPNMSGPLVEGDAVTYLPHIAPLKFGNRNHNVRLDIVAQEIEIAPE